MPSSPRAAAAVLVAVAALAALTVVVPLPSVFLDLLVVATVVAAVLADRSPGRRALRSATYVAEGALSIAVARMVAVRALQDAPTDDDLGVLGAVGGLLTGGNALIGSGAALVVLVALFAAALTLRAGRLRIVASGVALALAAAGAGLALHGGSSDTDALRAFARAGVGTALLFSIPVVVALVARPAVSST